MSEEKWFVALDGSQLDGEHDMSQIRQLLSLHAGKQLLVWNESMSGWTDPRTLPQFRPAPSAGGPVRPAPAAPAAGPTPLAAAAAARGQQAKEAVQAEAKFFKGLVDPSFDTLVTPKIIRTLYIIAMILVALGTIGFMLTGIRTAVSGGGFGVITGLVMVIIAPIVAIIYLAFIRVSFELAITLFRIKDFVQHIAEREKR